MAVFDAARYLRNSVGSVLAQTIFDWELVIVDDASSDDTWSILSDFAAKEPRIRAQRLNGPAGQTVALNKGLALCRGRYVARLDADDSMFAHRLGTQVEFLQGHPEVGVVGAWAELVDVEGAALGVYRVPTTDGQIRRLMRSRNPFLHSSVAFRRDLVLAQGGYDERVPVAQDYDLWIRLSACSCLANLGEPLIQYRLHEESVSGNPQTWRRQARGHASIQWRAIRRRLLPTSAAFHILRPLIHSVLPDPAVRLLFRRRRQRYRHGFDLLA